MNYRRSGSLCNSSTSSRSSHPRRTVSNRETHFLFAVLLFLFTRFFLHFFSVSMSYFIIVVPTACETVSESTRA